MKDNFMLADNALVINLFECGYEKTIPTKIFSFTPKDYYVVHLVVAGRGYLETNNKTYKLKKGALFFIEPHEHPHYYPDELEPWTYIWLGFGGPNISQHLASAEITAALPVMYDDEKQTVRQIMQAICERHSKTGVFDLFTIGYAYQFLATIVKIRCNDQCEISVIDRHYNRACQFILNNYAFQITIEDVASNVGITPNYLSAIFQTISGISTKKYLNNVRMNEAKTKILLSSLSIQEIASAVGFINPLYFSTAFKKYYGSSPTSFRKQNK